MHSRPLTDFLGPDPEYYHLLFEIHRLASLEAFLSLLTGTEVKLEARQTGGPSASANDLSEVHRKKIERFYQQDYDIWGQFITGPGAGVVKRRTKVPKR